MVTPIIRSITREVFDTVPATANDAAYALGATRWEMMRMAVFPHSRAGVAARQPFEGAIDRAWGAALTLILLVFVLTAVVRLVARRFTNTDGR